RDSILRDLKPRDNLLPFDVDVPRLSAVSPFVKERILLVTCNTDYILYSLIVSNVPKRNPRAT
ncbi:hypothetical protein COCHEDRAFT_1118035, partial [Bipolaris maydis C5]